MRCTDYLFIYHLIYLSSTITSLSSLVLLKKHITINPQRTQENQCISLIFIMILFYHFLSKVLEFIFNLWLMLYKQNNNNPS